MSPELHDRWLRVFFDGRGHADFHYRWLRHKCDQDLHPTTKERMLCSSELPDELRASTATVSDSTLIVTWSPGDRTSRYPLGWLEEHAYARDRGAAAIPSDVAAITIDGATLPLRAARAIAWSAAFHAAGSSESTLMRARTSSLRLVSCVEVVSNDRGQRARRSWLAW